MKTKTSYFAMRLLLALLLGNLTTFMTSAQTALCPPNLDFETATFNNWECRTGSVADIGGVNTISWSGFTQAWNQHTIIRASDNGIDPYGLFPQACPNGSRYSVRLGNSASGAQAEGIFYTFTIPAAVTSFSIIYHYAIVLFEPGHAPSEQPRFVARVVDAATNRELDCVSFGFTSSASLPGFQVSSINSQVLYKDWTPITLDLSSYAGQTIRLEFMTSDCTRGGHFGYAYIDVNAACNGAIIGSTICQGETEAHLRAPYGFASYEWYADNAFSSIIGTTATLDLNPAPAVGTVYPVVVTPFPGFGCKDTLYAVITTAPKPLSVAGIDATACRYKPHQLGGPSTVGYNYSWTPVSNLDDPAISNPVAINTTFSPIQYIVNTTDLLTGCVSADTVIIATQQVDTAMNAAGKMQMCDGETFNTVLTATSSANAIQWYRDGFPIGGATGITYQPFLTGSYWAEISQNGCVDSTRQFNFAIKPLPQASFTASSDTQCVNAPFTFTNSTTISSGELINYLWKFSDGTTSTFGNATVTFTSLGDYTVELVATSSSGCKDSTDMTVKVLPNGVPDFVWDSVCIDRPVQFTNLSQENNSPSVTYTWDFGSKASPATSDTKEPPMITFDTPGTYDITLGLATLGCENDSKSITRKVQVNAPKPGIRYRTQTFVENTVNFIEARTNIGNIYNWTPQMQLNASNMSRPAFTAIDDVDYRISIIDEHTCVTVDSFLVQVLKKQGFYLPSAFSPNGDGLNDIVKPYLVKMKDLKRFTIFNRNGQVVFSTTKQGEGWNGMFKGRPADVGVYVWSIEYITVDNAVKFEKGTITLIR